MRSPSGSLASVLIISSNVAISSVQQRKRSAPLAFDRRVRGERAADEVRLLVHGRRDAMHGAMNARGRRRPCRNEFFCS